MCVFVRRRVSVHRAGSGVAVPRVQAAAQMFAGCYALLVFVAIQPFMYGQARDVDFMCRSLTLAGGLLLLIWGENDKQRNTELMGTGGACNAVFRSTTSNQ